MEILDVGIKACEVLGLSGKLPGELPAWNADGQQLRWPGAILLMGDQLGQSGLEFSEFLGNIDESRRRGLRTARYPWGTVFSRAPKLSAEDMAANNMVGSW